METTLSYHFNTTRVQSDAISLAFPRVRNAVYGTSALIIGSLGHARGQPGAKPVGRVEGTAEHDHHAPPRPRALERGRRRLRAGTGHPGILEQEDVSVRPDTFGLKSGLVGV